MKYFLTGATGFLGGSLAKQLRTAAHEAVALVRQPYKAGTSKEMGAQIVQGDITDKTSMQEPMPGCDSVLKKDHYLH
jgi:uncharacterized protein YbjT (DUF2867 family)